MFPLFQRTEPADGAALAVGLRVKLGSRIGWGLLERATRKCLAGTFEALGPAMDWAKGPGLSSLRRSVSWQRVVRYLPYPEYLRRLSNRSSSSLLRLAANGEISGEEMELCEYWAGGHRLGSADFWAKAEYDTSPRGPDRCCTRGSTG